MLIEFHILQNHSPANLNRDDTGSPKECTFGGYRRARISSQCLKRSIRRSELFQQTLEGRLGQRTRQLPVLVASRLKSEPGATAEILDIVEKKVSGFGNRDGKEQERDKTTGHYLTAQTMFLTEEDIAAVTDVMRSALLANPNAKKLEAVKAADLQALAEQKNFRPIAVDVALFGRMVTSGAFRDVEASAQVAHAISTHKVDHEFDYFTAVDDLQGSDESAGEEDSGADMIGDVEFNSACFYKYASIDVNGLIDNLTGSRMFRRTVTDVELDEARKLAALTVGSLLEAAARVTPSGKQNTFASHTLPALILVEVRPKRTPVSYANAFVEPARQNHQQSLVEASIKKLSQHVETLHAAFNLESAPRLLFAPESKTEIEGATRVASLRELREALEGAIRGNG